MEDKKTSENKKDEILKAATEEFLEKGYDGTKTTAIAKKAGVTHAMLHYYFKTKENLFNEVYNDKIVKFAKSLGFIIENSNKSLECRIREGVATHFDYIKSEPMIPRFVINELIGSPIRRNLVKEKAKTIINYVIPFLQREYDAEVEKGKFVPMDIFDLILDVASLNVFVFVALPLLDEVFCPLYGGTEAFIERRKQENIEIIMKRILVNPT